MNDEEPPSKKNKPPIEPTSILSLPDDLLVSCFARVSRLYYPVLSLVSKQFRSLLLSPELYQTRSQLGRTDNCIYVCLRASPDDPGAHWFMLCRRPNKNYTRKVKKKKFSGYVLVKIPSAQSLHVPESGLVAVGSNIYNIGGEIDDSPSSSVSILDCWSHTWRKAPNMLVKRAYLSANHLDGKIYVTGGTARYSSSKWMEVFDPKMQTWETVSSPEWSITMFSSSSKTNNIEVDGKLYIFGDRYVVYNPKDGNWNRLGISEMNLHKKWSSSCVIENVLYYYCYVEEEIKWFDTKARSWRTLQGIKRVLPKFSCSVNVKLADYGGKMALFWDKFKQSGYGYHGRTIWCAMIALERRNNDEEIWGKVEWYGAVLPLQVPLEYSFEYVGAVTV